jgi:hypothetical protein
MPAQRHHTQQDYEIKWPIIDAECNFGRVTDEHVANAASRGVPVNMQALVDGAEEVDMGMLINKLDSIETLATYVKDPAEAARVAAGKFGKYRANR